MKDEENEPIKLEEFKSEKLKGREEVGKSALEVLKGLHPVALHQFGSGGRNTSDEFSDFDFFATMRDEDFDKAVETKVETWSKVAPILVRLYNKTPNPAGWYQDSVIYDTDKGLFHVDYYLTPRSKVILPPDSKLIMGEDGLPRGTWTTWTIADNVDRAGHDLYEAVLAMSYIGVKKVVRKNDAPLFDFLRKLYNGYKRDKNPSVPDLPEENDFGLINSILGNLKEEGSEGQKSANQKIQEYLSQVEQLYSTP